MSLSTDERLKFQTQYSEMAVLAGGLAHEIKNSLSTVGLNLELCVEDLAESESQRDRRILKKIQTVQVECEHLEKVLEEFLRFARVGSLTLCNQDLSQLVVEFVEFFRPGAVEKGVEIRLHLAADLPPVRLDRDLFRQVLQNLVLNSVQALPKGGAIEIFTFVRAGRVVLEIIDTGCGMSASTLSRIFDVFFSTKREGSGLGLPTVKRIIEAHGGQIECSSEPGHGTRFRVTLPVSAETTEAAASAMSAAASA